MVENSFKEHPGVRRCNQPGCDGRMHSTTKIQNNHREYYCVRCGHYAWWLDNPKLDGCIGQFHKMQDNKFSGLSMMSDPYFHQKGVIEDEN